MSESNSSHADDISVDRARLGSITVYDVTEDELEMLETGSPSSNYLNISISLLSAFLAFLITLLTVEIADTKKFIFFIVATVVTAVVGGVLLLLWFLTRKSANDIFRKIRARKSPEEIRQIIREEMEDTQSELIS